MQELLQVEERDALNQRYTSVDVVPAAFPSIKQLDPRQQTALQSGMRLWMERVERCLAVALRTPCAALPPRLEALRSVSTEEVYQVVMPGEEAGGLLIAVPRAFAAGLCERLFGAPMSAGEDRALLSAERPLLQEMVSEWISALHAVFGVALGSPQLLENVPEPSEDSLRFACAVRCGAVEGCIGITFSPKVLPHFLGGACETPDEVCSVEAIQNRVGEVPLTLEAVLGKAQLSFNDLAHLRVGDVITLDRRAEGVIDLVLDNNVVFLARAGLTGPTIVLELVSGPKEFAVR